MIPAAVLNIAMSCSSLLTLQDSVLSNLGDGSTLTISTVRSMHSRINDALDSAPTCLDERNSLTETLFGLEEIMYQLNKSKRNP